MKRRTRAQHVSQHDRVVEVSSELEGPLARPGRLLESPGVQQLLCEVAVGGRASEAVATRVELLERPPVAVDGGVEVAPGQLDHPEVDQAAAELLDAADLLGELEPASERRGSLVVLAE